MMAEWFLTGADLSFLTDNFVTWFAFGIGLGAVLWVVGYMIRWIILFLRY